MELSAGALRTKIQLQKKTAPEGIYGEPTYTDYASVFASWKELNSVELLKNDSLQGYRYATVVTRMIEMDGTFRVLKDGESWEVLGYPKELRPGWIEFKVQRAVAG